MASIVTKKGRYCVVYLYTDENGNRKQKWETYKTKVEAKNRKKEIEYKEKNGTFVIPQCRTLDDLLKEYVALYGKDKWAMSTYSSNVALIEHYISPLIGDMKLLDINTRVIEKYYQQLLKTKRIEPTVGKKRTEYCTASMVKSVHKILCSCFKQAVKWELIEKNPCLHATVPKVTYNKRDIWTAETLFHAMEVCDDDRLNMCMNLAFACSMRIGEVLGLTWDCVDIAPESIESGMASIYINKELQRVSKEALKTLNSKDVILVFPSLNSQTTTVQVLKKPKTETSIRKVFLPKTVAEMLIQWKEKQDAGIELLGDEYRNFNLVISGPMGMPTEAGTITSEFHQLIEKNELPKVVFHSIRHSSVTYKLKLNGGDVKAVQGDSGHAQVKMVTDVYSHILDDDRKNNAQLFEDAFYGGKGKEPGESDEEMSAETAAKQAGAGEAADVQQLLKLLTNPDTAALIKTLAKSL